VSIQCSLTIRCWVNWLHSQYSWYKLWKRVPQSTENQKLFCMIFYIGTTFAEVVNSPDSFGSQTLCKFNHHFNFSFHITLPAVSPTFHSENAGIRRLDVHVRIALVYVLHAETHPERFRETPIKPLTPANCDAVVGGIHKRNVIGLVRLSCNSNSW